MNACVRGDDRYEYIALALAYKLGRRVGVELGALLVGFYSVIPHQLVSVFLTSEVQLLLAGLPQIDVNDWRFNTLYVHCHKGSHVVRFVSCRVASSPSWCRVVRSLARSSFNGRLLI